MWLNPEEMSKWAYYYCKDIKDKPEIRIYITNPYWSYSYCRDIKDRLNIRKNITEQSIGDKAYILLKYYMNFQDV